jgi:hypothetical protein
VAAREGSDARGWRVIGAAAVALSLAAGAVAQGEARYRFELAGEAVGVADLASRCDAERCTVRWSVRTRAPEAGDGAVHVRRVEAEVDPEGRWWGGPLQVTDDGVPVPARGVRGRAPSAMAELLLTRAAVEPVSCVELFDERTGEMWRGCGRRGPSAAWELEQRGEPETVRLAWTGLPAEVILPGQRARFVADPKAEVPARPPRLFGVTVPWDGDPARARRFCGVAADPPAAELGEARLPPAPTTGGSCRERTGRWLEGAKLRGLKGRAAVGLAWDGAAFAWHEWAEVELEGRWIAVDPTFDQFPARGARFTLARFADGDAVGRAVAGRRVLACWGRGRIE